MDFFFCLCVRQPLRPLLPPHPATSHSRRDTISLPPFTLSLSSHPPTPPSPFQSALIEFAITVTPPWADFASQPISLAVCCGFFIIRLLGGSQEVNSGAVSTFPSLQRSGGAGFSERHRVNELLMDSARRMNNSGQEGRDELLLLSRSKQKDLRTNANTVATLLHP